MTNDASAITVTILVDNQAPPGLLSEHGFSAWVEAAGRRLLFDTGQGPALAANADALGVDLRAVETLVLSHGHYDHTGGIPFVLGLAPTVEIHLHPAATGARYAIRDGVAKPIDVPDPARRALEAHPPGVRWTTEPHQFTPDVGLTGPVPRVTGYEDTGGPFFTDPEGREPDPITDDMALWMRSDRGLVVVAGCSHAGVVNTLRHALAVSGETRLHAVLGGFHLNAASEHRLARTMEDLQALGPDLVVPCHCTGAPAVERLEQALGARVVRGSAGAVFRFGGAPARGSAGQCRRPPVEA
jgi:7,8-dihydropterin-6-yl-methyl-4-(beta-D-ribofuranosyl)aminobenzene 5'-phosphate synthase